MAQSLRTNVSPEYDTLGRGFISSKSTEQRRLLGAIYTPQPVVDAMIAWASAQGRPRRIVDAGAGSGRFAIAAAKAFAGAEVVAVEIDPEAARVLRANLRAAGLSDRITVVEDDYRSLCLDRIEGRTLFIGNPPYVRHHAIDRRWKSWYVATARRFGVHASQLAGLHLHFFFKTLELASPGDVGIFITAAEWLDVNYGHALRTALIDGMGGLAIDLFAADSAIFDDAMTTAAITTFEIGAPSSGIAIQRVDAAARIGNLGRGRRIPADVLAKSRKWSVLADADSGSLGTTELQRLCVGDLFRVKRGQVTGMNRVWVAGPDSPVLPERFMRPTVTRAQELIRAGGILADGTRLRRVVDLPPTFVDLTEGEHQQLHRFLAWAKSQGAADGYIASHRRAWWAVGLYEPAPILCTYMGRRPPVFVRNACGARHINIAHGLYPKFALSPSVEQVIVDWLNANVARRDGRTYAGGLTKFEPREIERLSIPALADLVAA